MSDGQGLKVGATFAVVVGLVAGGAYFATRGGGHGPAASGSAAPSSSADRERLRLEEALAKEPCDRQLAAQLVRRLGKGRSAGDARAKHRFLCEVR